MTAAFGQLLIFEMDARHAGILEQSHGSLDVERLAEAGVSVAQQRQGRRQHDRPRRLDELRQRQQAHIGQRGRGGQGCAGEIHGLKADTLGDPPHERVEHARHSDRRCPPRIAQPATG